MATESIDISTVIGVCAILAFMGMTRNNIPEYRLQIEELQKDLEIAHEHQYVLEEEIHDMESSIFHIMNAPPATNPENLRAVILTLLQNNKSGMKCKEILNIALGLMPDLTKNNINSILYKMKNMKIIREKKTSEKAPTWVLA